MHAIRVAVWHDAPVLSEELCRDLVLAARAEDKRESARIVGVMDPDVRRYVLTLCRGKLGALTRKVGVTGDEVGSHVVERMLKKPPVGRDDRQPIESVLTWIRMVTKNYLVDQHRRLERRPATEIYDEKVTPDLRPSAHAQLENRQLRGELQAMVEACYPRALPLLTLTMDEADPDGSDSELARQLGTTPANVYQVRRRMRLYVKSYLKLQATPTVSDRALSEALETTDNADTRGVFAKVRQYLALHRKGSN